MTEPTAAAASAVPGADPDAASGGVSAHDVPARPDHRPPVTGHHDIDRALAALELGADVTTHPAALSAALDAVSQALSGQLPAGLRPRP